MSSSSRDDSPLPAARSMLSLSPSISPSTSPILLSSSSSALPLSSPSNPSKKRLRPESIADLHLLPPSSTTLSSSSSSSSPEDDQATRDSFKAASILSSSPPPAPLSLSVSSLASSKRRAASDNSLTSLDKKQQGNLHTLLAESSDDESEEHDDDDGSDDDEEEEEEKSPIPTPPGAMTPLSSMATAAAASVLSSPLGVYPSHPSSHVPHSHPSLTDSSTEFSSQLFVIYMPKSNFKRFIISSLNTTIIRSAKGEKQPVPRMNFPSLHQRPVIPPLTSSTSSSPSSSSPSKPSPSDSDQFTYNVSMEDVLSCLEAHGVRYNTGFMWMDLSDFGARFVQQMMGESGAGAIKDSDTDEVNTNKSEQYGGLWYNVVHKSHLVVNHFSHPFLGEGYAVVITLDLLDSNKDQATVSPAAMEQSQTQTITVANDTLYKATKNINEGGITAHPALLTSTSNPPPTSLNPLSPFPSPLPPSDPPSRRKVRPVESIGEMLDRIGEYQRIRLQVKSKNKACEKLGYSKGTINAYREKVKQAVQLGIDLNAVRKTKYRDFKRVLAAAQQQGGGGGSPGMGSGAGKEKGKKEDGLKKRSNSFGDLGLALMARQDAKNGRRKGKGNKSTTDEERRRSDGEDEEDEQGEGEDEHDQSPSYHYRRRAHDSSSPPLPVTLSSSSPHAHHLQPVASLLPSSSFSPSAPHRSSIAPLSSQVTYVSTAPHTFTTTSLPPGTTYVLNSAPLTNAQQLTTTTFASQYGAYAPSAYGTVYTTGQAGPQVMRANGTTYQVVQAGSGHQHQHQQVQMAQNIPTQATPTSMNVRYL